MSYQIVLLPVARQDLMEQATYISQTLCNPSAAERLANQIERSLERISLFPYSNPVYHPLKPLAHEYRNAVVENYLVFYWVDEERKLVTVARVIYSRRDLQKLL